MWWRLACVVVAAALAHEPASAQDSAAQFYKGKQITVIVGSSAGGGYDIYARLLSRHMPKHVPGNPAMVVTNMTGAGSNAAAAPSSTSRRGTAPSSVRCRTAPFSTRCSTRCSATPGGCGTTPRNSSISVPRPSTTTSASPAPTRP
jgi:tripartite-type tricarboxylate transporter receptor subunit TctC